jgi:hypothetical protein
VRIQKREYGEPSNITYRNRSTFKRFQCEQATFVSDGCSVLEPISNLRFCANTLLELCLGIVQQMDPTLLPRIDAEKFLSSISGVIDGERVRAPSWDLAPGWKGKDVEIGTQYADLLQSSFGVSSVNELASKDPQALLCLWNSDNHETDHPFDKPRLTQARDEWNTFVQSAKVSVPVCAREAVQELGGRYGSQRKGAMQSAQNTNKKRPREHEGRAQLPPPKRRKKLAPREPTPGEFFERRSKKSSDGRSKSCLPLAKVFLRT